ncbi:MAG: hypothetical protein LLG14_08895 [Nocardiaceae bacterium]|nr:hypothetical protein [Nocardiaceae bacterium]
MSIKPSKRIVKGAAGLAIATAMFAPGVASAANAPSCSGLLSGDGKLCISSMEATQKSGLFGSIPLIGPILDSLFSGLGS